MKTVAKSAKRVKRRMLRKLGMNSVKQVMPPKISSQDLGGQARLKLASVRRSPADGPSVMVSRSSVRIETG